MPNRESGLTLAEICMSLVIFVTLSVAVMSILFTITKSQKNIQGKLRAEAMAEQVIQQVKDDLEYASLVLQAGTMGNEYMTRLGVVQRSIPGSRLPVSSALGHFAADPKFSVQTGNLLVIARGLGQARVETTTTSGADFARFDQYQFVAYLLTEKDGALDLERGSSVRLVHAGQLQRYTDASRRLSFGAALYAEGLRYAWNPNESVAECFYRLAEDGSTTRMPETEALPMDPHESELDILSRRHFGVVRNGTPAPLKVPLYARAKTGFPHGFEIKIDDSGSQLLILLRLVVIPKTKQGIGAVATREVLVREE